MSRISQCFIHLFFVLPFFCSSSLFAQEMPITDELAHVIILNGTPDDVKKLLENNSDVDRIFLCNTLLNTAIKSMVSGSNAKYPNNAIEKVKILIEGGANVNKIACSQEQAITPLGWVALLPVQSYEVEYDEIKRLEELTKTESEYCDLPNIISKPCKDITSEELKSIKEIVHQIYSEARKQYNPLFLDMLKLLIENGANVNQKDFAGQTALHKAALTPRGETLELMKYLIAKGADVNAQDLEGNTPLFIAFAIKNSDAVNLLIASGANTSIKNNEGITYDLVEGKRKKYVYEESGEVKTLNYNFD